MATDSELQDLPRLLAEQLQALHTDLDELVLFEPATVQALHLIVARIRQAARTRPKAATPASPSRAALPSQAPRKERRALMRGSLKQRSKGSWSIRLDFGYETDPATGRQKRQQRCHTIRGTRKQAEDKLADLLKDVKDGPGVASSALTLADWLREWLAASTKRFRPSTYTRYQGIIERYLAPSDIGRMPLQKLRSTHLERHYAESTIGASTLTLHHTVLHRALRKAKKDGLIAQNIAADLDGRPRRPRGRSEDARAHCWTAGEAQAFLLAANASSPQDGAFYGLALDTGARKGELCGLAWADVSDLGAGRVHIVRQLDSGGARPTFGPPKGKRPRTVTLSAETIALLQVHRQQQRELMMRNRPVYQDHGLVFAKEWGELRTRKDCLGHPLQANNLGERSFNRLITAAGLRRIKFHGLRHTCATLLLLAGEAVHVVSQRLGHRDVQTTLNTYAHALPDAQQGAANRLAAVLYGGR